MVSKSSTEYCLLPIRILLGIGVFIVVITFFLQFLAKRNTDTAVVFKRRKPYAQRRMLNDDLEAAQRQLTLPRQ
jgi:hypothetical protein